MQCSPIRSECHERRRHQRGILLGSREDAGRACVRHQIPQIPGVSRIVVIKLVFIGSYHRLAQGEGFPAAVIDIGIDEQNASIAEHAEPARIGHEDLCGGR